MVLDHAALPRRVLGVKASGCRVPMAAVSLSVTVTPKCLLLPDNPSVCAWIGCSNTEVARAIQERAGTSDDATVSSVAIQ